MKTKIYNNLLSETLILLDNGELQRAFKLAVQLPDNTDSRTAIRVQLLQLIFAGNKEVIKTFLNKVYLMDYAI